MKLGTIFIFLLILVFVIVSSNLGNFDPLYPYGCLTDCDYADEYVMQRSDDGEMKIDVEWYFFAKKYNHFYVNNNGLISFQQPVWSYVPESFPFVYGPILAPFWADVDTRCNTCGNVYYRLIDKNTGKTDYQHLLDIATNDVRTLYPSSGNFTASKVFIATWSKVARYSKDDSNINTFQSVMITDNIRSYAMFNYAENGINWMCGLANYNYNNICCGVESVRSSCGEYNSLPNVGFDRGDGIYYYNMPESRTEQVANLPINSNCDINGRYIFRTDLSEVYAQPKDISTDTTLAKIIINDGTISPAFDQDITSYHVQLASNTQTDLIIEANDIDATIYIDQIEYRAGEISNLKYPQNDNNNQIITILVLAANGIDSQEYIIEFENNENVANIDLSLLKVTVGINNYVITPITNIYEYDITVDSSSKFAYFQVATESLDATITYNLNTAIAITSFSAELLYGNLSSIKFIVTAANNLIQQEYIININMDLADDCSLVDSTVHVTNVYDLSLVGDAFIGTVRSSINQVTINAIPTDANAIIVYDETEMDQLSISVPLFDGLNEFPFIVYAENRTLSQDYIISLTKLPEQNETQITKYRTSGNAYNFTVPLGVFTINYMIEGAPGSNNGHGYAVSGSINVQPNDILTIYTGNESNECGGEASWIKLADGQLVILVAGGHLNYHGASFTNDNNNLAGQGINGCGTLSKKTSLTYNVQEINSYGTARVDLSYDIACAEGYTLLHSDYNPLLIPSSSLQIKDNKQLLALDIAIPIYYYNVQFEYPNQCNNHLPQVRIENHGCNNHYFTTIEYNEYCNFELLIDPNDETQYLYRGHIRATALLDLKVNNLWTVQRTVSSPIYWQVRLQRTISVSTEVSFISSGDCTTDHQCNNQGCCIDGQCHCDCNQYNNGYTGTYCEEDIEAPICHNIPNDISLDSDGGCVILGPDYRNLITNLPYFNDNSGVIDRIQRVSYVNSEFELITDFNPLNDDILTTCFSLGLHSYSYTIYDIAGNSNICTFRVIVTDGGKSLADCNNCQDQKDYTKICQGTNDSNQPYIAKYVLQHELESYFADNVMNNVYKTQYPGQVLDLTINHGLNSLYFNEAIYQSVYLTCNCTLDFNNDGIPDIITNNWNSWSIPQARDSQDDSPIIIPYRVNNENYARPLQDGIYIVEYMSYDCKGNVDICSINVTYDITAPTCDDFYIQAELDIDNSNYSIAITYPEIPINLNSDISGLDMISLVPERIQNDQYYIGYATSMNYSSTYYIQDKAGNIGTCNWLVHVTNPNPCLDCEDLAPIVDYCPQDIILECNDTTDCNGCGNWNEPIFSDDHGIINIIQNYDALKPLGLGRHNITYIAFDILNQTAICNFQVTIQDTISPRSDNCPQDQTFELLTGIYYNYSYSFDVYDQCNLNQNIRFDLGTYFDEVTNMPSASNVQLAMGIHSFIYRALDDHDNAYICSWTITIMDAIAPVITCPENIIARIPQPTQATTVINFQAEASDNDIHDPNLLIDYSPIQPNDPLAIGSYTITATVTDLVGLTDSCIFTIQVVEPYPKPELDIVVIESDVKLFDNNQFGTVVTFLTSITPYHQIDYIEPLHADIQGDIIEIDAECHIIDVTCVQYWSMIIYFDDCEIDHSNYQIGLISDCKPDNCLMDASIFNATISLTASNYCWQTVDEIIPQVYFKTTTPFIHQQYRNDYDAQQAVKLGTALYPIQEIFYQDNHVAGIIEVVTDQVELKQVEIINLYREFYQNADYTGLVSNMTLITNKLQSIHVDQSFIRADFASFDYQETFNLNGTIYFAKYQALIEIEYQLAAESTSTVRRRLFISDLMRDLLVENTDDDQENTIASYTYTNALFNPLHIDPDDYDDDVAVVITVIQNCHNPTDLWQDIIQTSVADYLRIIESRIQIKIQFAGNGGGDEVNSGSTTSSTGSQEEQQHTQDYCLVETILREIDCVDAIDILKLLDVYQQGIMDFNSCFHQLLIDNDPTDQLPDDIQIDSNIFLIVKYPTDTEEEIIIDDDDEPSLNNTEPCHVIEQQDETNCIIYAIIGVLAGLLSGCLCCGCCFIYKKNKKDPKAKHLASLDDEIIIGPNGKRASVANLLMALHDEAIHSDENDVEEQDMSYYDEDDYSASDQHHHIATDDDDDYTSHYDDDDYENHNNATGGFQNSSQDGGFIDYQEPADHSHYDDEDSHYVDVSENVAQSLDAFKQISVG